MTKVQQLDPLLAELLPEEKAQLLQRLVTSLSGTTPGIVHTPGVNGGRATIVRTRIPVFILIEAKRAGSSDADILQAFPSLTAEDLVNAYSYYWNHREEIERDLAEQEEDE